MKGNTDKVLFTALFLVIIGAIFYVLTPKYDFLGVPQIAGIMRCNRFTGQVDFAFPGQVGGASYGGWKTISSDYTPPLDIQLPPGASKEPGAPTPRPEAPVPAPKMK